MTAICTMVIYVAICLGFILILTPIVMYSVLYTAKTLRPELVCIEITFILPYIDSAFLSHSFI